MTKSIGLFEHLDHSSLKLIYSYLYSYDCLRFLSTSKALAHEVGLASEAKPGDHPPLTCKGWITRFSCFVANRIAVVLETAYDMGPPASYPKIRAASDCRMALRMQCVRFLLNAVHSREQEQDEKRRKAKMHFFKLYKRSCLPSHVVMTEFVDCLMRKADNVFASLVEPPSPSYSM